MEYGRLRGVSVHKSNMLKLCWITCIPF